MTTQPGTVGDFAIRLTEMFNLGKAAGWDPVGLQLGDRAAPVTRIAVCHEITPAVTDQLIAIDVDLVVAYHPLLFRPTRTLVAGTGAAGRAFRLIRAGVAVVTTHTAFDVAPGGTADCLAEAIGLTDSSGFGPAWGPDTAKIVTFAPAAAVAGITAAMAQAGAGIIGRYAYCSYRSEGEGTFLPAEGAAPVVGSPGVINHEPETRIEMPVLVSRADRVAAALVAAHPYEEPAYDVIEARSNAGFIGRVGRLERPVAVSELAGRVAERLGGVVRVAGSGIAATAAVIPGSGGSMLGDVDADVVVTGDIGHHQARDAVARGLAVIDPGHAATERPGVRSLYAAVAQMAGDVVDMTDIDADPWKER